MSETGLSEHRTGWLLAKNGRLIERLRRNGRIWPDTEQRVAAALAEQEAKRASGGRVVSQPATSANNLERPHENAS